MGEGLSNPPDLSSIRALIPTAPTLIPPAEATTGQIGAAGMYASAAHVHPRLTSVQIATLDANGLATVMFARSFAAQPGVILTPINPVGSQPVMLQVQGWTNDTSGNFIGCSIKGYRTNTLPSTLALLSALISFNIAGGSAANVQVSVVAIQSS